MEKMTPPFIRLDNNLLDRYTLQEIIDLYQWRKIKLYFRCIVDDDEFGRKLGGEFHNFGDDQIAIFMVDDNDPKISCRIILRGKLEKSNHINFLNVASIMEAVFEVEHMADGYVSVLPSKTIGVDTTIPQEPRKITKDSQIIRNLRPMIFDEFLVSMDCRIPENFEKHLYVNNDDLKKLLNQDRQEPTAEDAGKPAVSENLDDSKPKPRKPRSDVRRVTDTIRVWESIRALRKGMAVEEIIQNLPSAKDIAEESQRNFNYSVSESACRNVVNAIKDNAGDLKKKQLSAT